MYHTSIFLCHFTLCYFAIISLSYVYVYLVLLSYGPLTTSDLIIDDYFYDIAILDETVGGVSNIITISFS